MKLALVIIYIQTALSGVIALTCFYKFYDREKYIRLLGLLFLCSCLANALALNNMSRANVISSIYDFLLIVILTAVYAHLTRGKYIRLFLILCGVVALFSAVNLIFIQRDAIASYNKLLGSFVILFYTILYFYRLMVELPATHLTRLPAFWINSAFLVFHAGTIFLFAFVDYLVNVLNDNLLHYWAFHNVLFIVEQLIVLVALAFDLRHLRSSAGNIASS